MLRTFGKLAGGRAPLLALLLAAGLCGAGSLPHAASAQTASAYTWKNVQVVGGGFVPGIIFNQTEPGLVYARTDIGGAYRQDPVTKRWIPLTDWLGWDDWNLTGVISLATDPVNPNKFYAFANGTFYTSADGGANFSPTVTSGLPPWAKIKAVPGREGDVWLAGGFEGDATYGMYRSTNSTFTANLVTATAGANATSYPATGLTANTTYFFRVRATTEAGDSANSNTASATTRRR